MTDFTAIGKMRHGRRDDVLLRISSADAGRVIASIPSLAVTPP
jgi:hypothetical protein